MIPTARNVLTRPPTGTPRRASCPGEGLPISYAFLEGSGRGCPLLRASNEHRFTVRVLRARRAPGRSLPILLRPRVARARGSAQHPAPFFSILLRAMHVLRQELLNPTAHLVEPLSCLEIRKEIGQVAPHSLAVPIHHGQIGSDMRREIDLVDDK